VLFDFPPMMNNTMPTPVQARGMPIDMVLFRTALDPFEGPHEEELGWRRVTTGRITVEYLPGTHQSLLTAGGSQDLASRLEPYLRCRLVSSGRGPIGANWSQHY
jgi:hypothetical protein